MRYLFILHTLHRSHEELKIDGATEIHAHSCERAAASLRTLTCSVKVQRSGKGRVLSLFPKTSNGFHRLVNMQAVFSARAAAAAAAVCLGSSASASPGERATCGGENPAEQITIITGATVLHWARQSWCAGKHTNTEYYCITVLHWVRQSWCAGKHKHRVLLCNSTSLS